MNKLANLLSAILLIFSLSLMNSCKKDKSLAVLTTSEISDITLSTAKSGGNITNEGGAEVIERGVTWGTSENPTTAGSKTSDGIGAGSFESQITGLRPGSTYYVRAYATNSEGTSYGNQEEFSTLTDVPTLTTALVTDITVITARSGGTVLSNGGDSIVARGICWGTTENPTIENSKTSDGIGSGSFVSQMTQMTGGTTYYVRAYATNGVGTGYGNQVVFSTLSIVLPAVTTAEITSITATTAISGGNVTNDGGGAITAKGVCWNLVGNPTTADNKSSDGAGGGSFSSDITGLSPGITYYVRAYATNSTGTSYGNQLTFSSITIAPVLSTVSITAITSNSAKSGGTITSTGGLSITAKGVCWSTLEEPTIEGNKTQNGTGSGNFVSDITGLVPVTTYYVRAYATNSAGTSYGNQLSFTTAPALPALTTAPVTGITFTTAISGGNITDDGKAPVTARGVCWSTSQNPTIANTRTQNGSGTGAYTSNLTGLTPGTTYYVRAYATNSAGTAYGPQQSFTTTPVGGATLTTTAITALTPVAAVSGGNITDNGGAVITARGVCWNTSPTPTIANSRTTNGTGNGPFISNITGLSNGTTYYVRAYATNSAGTSYGNELSFITPVADNQGNIYKTVQIGKQVWMAENLKVTRLNDNTVIPNVVPNSEWIALSTPAYSVYNNVDANINTYGLLYNWYALNTRQLCPVGWHEPSDSEYNTFEISLGLAPADTDLWGWRGIDGGLKSKNTTGWLDNGNGTNSSGFSVVPGGYRQWIGGAFAGEGIITYLWSVTDDAENNEPTVSWYRRFDSSSNQIYKATTDKKGGKYVRCVKD